MHRTVLNRRRQNGWTLIELMAAVAVLAILAGLALRGYGSSLDAARADEAATALLNGLTLAKAHAAADEVVVGLCPSVDGTACSDGGHWESGWIVFADRRGNGTRDADEPVYQVQPALPRRVHLVTSAGRTRLRFQPTGSNGFSNTTFTLCDGRGKSRATAFVLANDGRLRSAEPTDEQRVAACAPTR